MLLSFKPFLRDESDTDQAMFASLLLLFVPVYSQVLGGWEWPGTETLQAVV